MGKGDKKSRRGKIILGTYGVRRPKKNVDKAPIKPAEVVAAQKPAKKEKPLPEAKETKAPAVKEHKPKVEKTEKPVKQEKNGHTEKETKATKEPKPKKEKKE